MVVFDFVCLPAYSFGFQVWLSGGCGLLRVGCFRLFCWFRCCLCLLIWFYVCCGGFDCAYYKFSKCAALSGW